MAQSMSEQLKEATAVLRGAGDAHLRVGRLVKQALRATGMGGLPALPLVREACQGALAGLYLAGGDVPSGAVEALRAVAEWSADVGVDPMDALTSAIEGIAAALRGLPPADLSAVSGRLDAAFSGSAEAFNAACRRGR